MKLGMRRGIKELFSISEHISKVYNSNQIRDLPLAVQRYFAYALQENQRYISYIRLKHSGQFRPSKKWKSIKGEEYFSVQPPGFVWSGKVGFISGQDAYYKGVGHFQIELLSIFKLIDTKGVNYDQGELLRWLSETPWFPTALLPSERLKWLPVDSNSAQVVLADQNIKVEGIFFFNEQGQIIKFKAKRYNEGVLEDWICSYGDYRENEGMYVPFHVEASWKLESEDLTYAKFDIDQINYDDAPMIKS